MPNDATTLTPASTPVSFPYELDQGPGRHRIGLICLASDYATERDFMNMRPSDDVAVYTSRVRNANPTTVDNLRAMAPRLEQAAALIIPAGPVAPVPAQPQELPWARAYPSPRPPPAPHRDIP